MSTRAQSPPIRDVMFLGAIVLATVLVLTVFAWVNQTIGDREAAVRPSPAVVGWDAGKLEAMEGRQLAEMHRQEAADVGSVQWTMDELLEARGLAEVHRRELAAAEITADPPAPDGIGLPLSRQPGAHH